MSDCLETDDSVIMKFTIGSAQYFRLGRQIKALENEKAIDVLRDSWIEVGNTADAALQIETLPVGLVLARIFCAYPFFILEMGGKYSLHFENLEFEADELVLDISFQNRFDVGRKPESDDLIVWMGYFESDLFSSLKKHLLNDQAESQSQELRMFEGAIEPLVAEDGSPSESFLCALESALIETMAAEYLRAGPKPQNSSLSKWLQAALTFQYHQVYGFGLLEPLLSLPGLKEIMVNGFSQVFTESDFGMVPSGVTFQSQRDYEKLVESLLSALGERLEPSHPIAQGVLRQRYRVHIVSKYLCIDGPLLSIRCFPTRTFELEGLLGSRAKQCGMGEWFVSAIRNRKNILICGETSSGKTSLIEALSAFFQETERVVVVEDVRELRLSHEHKVYLHTAQGYGAYVQEVDLRALVKESLRMRPDRLIIGECRGGEALDLLQALNTGHAGSITSIHGSSPEAALHRLETLSMFGMARVSRETVSALVASGIDYVVQMKKAAHGARIVSVVSEIVSPDRDQEVLQSSALKGASEGVSSGTLTEGSRILPARSFFGYGVRTLFSECDSGKRCVSK